MAEQRVAMDARKAKMDEEMMQHMQMGKDSMSQCPMMKDMKGMKDMGDKSETPTRNTRRAEMTAERYGARVER